MHVLDSSSRTVNTLDDLTNDDYHDGRRRTRRLTFIIFSPFTHTKPYPDYHYPNRATHSHYTHNTHFFPIVVYEHIQKPYEYARQLGPIHYYPFVRFCI